MELYNAIAKLEKDGDGNDLLQVNRKVSLLFVVTLIQSCEMKMGVIGYKHIRGQVLTGPHEKTDFFWGGGDYS